LVNTAVEPIPYFYSADHKFDVAESPYYNPTHVETIPQKQIEQIEQNQNRLASDISTGGNLATKAGIFPRDILDK